LHARSRASRSLHSDIHQPAAATRHRASAAAPDDIVIGGVVPWLN
jgi:hypothetical protein